MLHHVLYLIHGNQHSQHPKNYKKQTLGNKMEGESKDSTVYGSRLRNRVDKCICLEKSKRKGVQKKKLIDTQCESDVNTVAEEFV